MREERIGATSDLHALAGAIGIAAVLDARLIRHDRAPVAVAFSGGGDSLALLLAAKAWADERGRRLLAFTVDHGLRPESAAWARFCRRRAAGLQVEHRTLAWEAEKPSTGVSAAARAARHRLLAGAARDAGAAVILMGHTADDRAEAATMREAGSTTPSPQVWSPSPVWPEGHGLFLLRPLLDLRRATLRRALAAHGETWIDDPGNTDPSSARARARALLAGGPVALPAAREPPTPCRALAAEEGPAGDLVLSLDRLTGEPDGLRVLAAALVCAAGAERPPRRGAVARLMAELARGGPSAATLAGACVHSDGGGRVRLVRDAGDTRRTALAELPLPPGRAVAWDGRFLLCARSAGLTAGPLAGRAGRLPPHLRRALAAIPPACRRALPLVSGAKGEICLPSLLPDPAVAVIPLALARLMAAAGGIIDEGSLRRMAKPDRPY